MQTDSEHLPPPNDKNISPDREPGEDKSATPAPEPGAPVSPAPGPAAGVEQRLRAEYAELADVAAQAARLGLKIDVAQAMAKSIRPDALRRSVLEQLAARSDAADLVAAQTQALNKPQGESPIVKRAREAASRS